MTIYAIDLFAGADGTLLSAHTADSGGSWAQVTTGWNGQVNLTTAQILSNKIMATTAGASLNCGAFYRYSVSPASADHYVQADFQIQSLPTDYVGVSCRAPTGSTIGGYGLLFDNTKVSLYRLEAAPTSLATDISVALSAGVTYTLRVGAVGTTITGQIKRLSDGYYLTSAGGWSATQQNCFSAMNGLNASAGYPTILVRGDASTGVLVDNFQVDDGAVTTAVTMTGPTTGTVGAASSNFTIGANGQITGTVVVTPSDGGAGGTFTPATVSISSGSPTGTFTYTAASTGAKTISVTNDGSLSNPSTITYTASASGDVTIAVTSTALYFSPYNWYSDGAGSMQSNNVKGSSSFAWSNMRGAYIKTKATVGASGYIKLNLDTTSLQTLAAAGCPTLIWSVGEAGWQTQLLAYSASGVQVTLASGLAAGTYDVFVAFRSVYITNEGDSWTTPLNKVHVTGLALSSGGSVSAPTVRPNTMLIYGDSITEGDLSNGGPRSASSQNALYTYGFRLADALNAEVGIVGMYGKTWSWFSSSWAYYSASFSRLVGGALTPAPTYIVSNYGENDGTSPPLSTINSVLAALSAAAPTAKIVLNVPFSQKWLATYQLATLPTNAVLTNIAAPEMASGALIWSYDGHHPNQEGHANLGARLAGTILSAYGAGDSALWDTVIEGSYTAKQIMRLLASAMLGKVSGAGSNAPVFRDLADAKNRITATVDASGNRTAVTLDGS